MSEYTNTTGLPSVTQALKPWIDTTWFTPESRDRGRAVHDALAHYLGGRPAFLCEIDPAWRGYFDSGRRWIDDNVLKPLLVEERLTDTAWRFCGQPDLICRSRTGFVALIDWKTGPAARWHRLQIAGYRHLAEDRYGTQIGATIRLKSDGSFPLVDEHPHNYEADLSRILGAVGLWWFFNPDGIQEDETWKD